MSLSSALSIAQSSIRNTGRQTSVVSRNVLESQQPRLRAPLGGACRVRRRAPASSRSTAPPTSSCSARTFPRSPPGAARARSITAWSSSAWRSTASTTPPRRPPRSASCRRRCSSIPASPSNRNLAENALDAARQVVRALNDGTTAIQTFRVETDQEIATAVDELNTLLADFQARQQRGHRRHARRPRRLRRARPARRAC